MSGIVDADQDGSGYRQRRLRRFLGFEVSQVEGIGQAEDFAGGPHLRPEHRIDFREHVERENRFLDAEMAEFAGVSGWQSVEGLPLAAAMISSVAILAIEMLQTLETSGTVRDARGLASRTVDFIVADRILHVHQADDVQFPGDLLGIVDDGRDHAGPGC